MAVLAGIWNFEGRRTNQVWLENAANSTSRYGPDGRTIVCYEEIGFLYQPFHTTVESLEEHQPYVSTQGHILLWNGRLDNRQELIRELHSDLTQDQSDVALIGGAFDRYGTACFAKLIGDWALSVWVHDRKELILARDYIGTRQLFYHLVPQQITWCTHLEALIRSTPRFSICHEYVAGYLSLYPPSHLTPYQEILSVPPGHFVQVRHSRATSSRYRTFDPQRNESFCSDAEYEQRFRSLLCQAVRRRLRSNSKILADLSGGLDSSSIVAVADTMSDLNKNFVDTFSYFDASEPDDQDLAYIELFEKLRGRRGHHGSVTSAGDSLCFEPKAFPPIPGFDGREEFKTARQDVVNQGQYRVHLSGHGGDEVNGQALDFRIPIADSLAHFHLRKAGRELITWSLRSRYPFIQLLWQSLAFLMPRILRWGASRHMTEVSTWINRDFAREFRAFDDLRSPTTKTWHWLPSARDAYQTIELLSRDMTNRLPSLVEERYPYLDQSLVEFLTSVPATQLLRPGSRRSLMRRSLSEILPQEIASRRTKASTGRCVVLTFQKHWKTIEKVLKTPIVCELRYIDHRAFRAVVEHTRNGNFTDLARTLRTLSLEYWLRQGIEIGVLEAPSSDWKNKPTARIQGGTKKAAQPLIDVAVSTDFSSHVSDRKSAVTSHSSIPTKGGCHYERIS